MTNREILVPTAEGTTVGLTVGAGVPQGSVLGSTLCHILYDGVLDMNIPQGIGAVAYADDLALVAVCRSVPELEEAVRISIDRVSAWMRGRGLTLAPGKTEAVMWRKRRYDDLPVIIVDGQEVTPSRVINYLWVRLDSCWIHASCGAGREEGRVGGNCSGEADAQRRRPLSGEKKDANDGCRE